MKTLDASDEDARLALANRLFFRLYQCANMLHKTGTRAVEAEGLTTQQWAVLGAVSRPAAARGLGINELARYLMVSRQNLSGVVARMERAGHLRCEADAADRRQRLVRLTPAGRALWEQQAQPKIRAYYAQVLQGFSVNDSAHALHYLLKILDNMRRIDTPDDGDAGPLVPDDDGASPEPTPAAVAARRRPPRRVSRPR